MGMFMVQPGRSFHAIQEVFAEGKPRMSIQGWFHSAEPPAGAELATRNQLQLRAGEDSVHQFEQFAGEGGPGGCGLIRQQGRAAQMGDQG